jgi:cytochrome c peroxidase
MRCFSCCSLLLLAVAVVAEGPILPKDTLPAQLAVAPVPLGLDQPVPVPTDNPFAGAKVALGRKLFFDPILSHDKTVACASCHQPEHGFASPDPLAIGIGGKKGRRNAPTLLNRAYARTLFWDGRETSLEAQALKPIEDPLEMGAKLPEVVERLRADGEYRKLFGAAFPDGVTTANLGRALATFERTLLLGNNIGDRFRRGDVGGMTKGQRHGMWLFESRGRCWKCHSGANLSDEQFHNTGVSWGKEPLDLGRYENTKVDTDRGKFKTPTLRGIEHTAPYMHDGSIATLKEVVQFYNRGGGKNPHLDPIIGPLGLSDEEVDDLTEFVKALSGVKQEAPEKTGP